MSNPDVTSWALIQRAAAGNPADRDTFARRYAPVVRSFFCARWKLPFEHEEVLDASQEVFVDCFQDNGALSRAQAAQPARFRAFLYGVARRVAARIERRLARRREITTRSAIQLDNIECSEVTLSKVFDKAWANMMVDEAGKLVAGRVAGRARRAEAFRILELRFRDNLPPRDIAKRLDLDVKHIYELLREGKQEFRAAFLQVMASHHPEATEAELEGKCIDLASRL